MKYALIFIASYYDKNLKPDKRIFVGPSPESIELQLSQWLENSEIIWCPYLAGGELWPKYSIERHIVTD